MNKDTHSSSSDTKGPNMPKASRDKILDPTVEQLGRDTTLALFLTISTIAATITFWYMLLY